MRRTDSATASAHCARDRAPVVTVSSPLARVAWARIWGSVPGRRSAVLITVTQLRPSRRPTITSGTTSVLDCSERRLNAKVPKATGPVPGSSRSVRTTADAATSSHHWVAAENRSSPEVVVIDDSDDEPPPPPPRQIQIKNATHRVAFLLIAVGG